MVKWITKQLIILCIVIISGSNAIALDYKDLTLYVPFDGSFKPVISKGDSTPICDTKQSTFTEGVISQAIIVGTPETALSYAVKGNINGKNGTLSVWIKPLNWSPGDGQQHVYMQIAGRMLFYHYWEGRPANFYWRNGNAIIAGTGGYPSLKKGEWCQLTVTWSDDKVTMYNNGKYLSHGPGLPADMPRWNDGENPRLKMATNSWTAKGNNQTAFDELMIFNRSLSSVEVMSLYRRSARNLPTPTIRISKHKNAPHIDGRMEHDEWAGSAGITGFLDRPFGNLSKKEIRSKLSYDKTSLYILVESEKSILKTAGSVEIWIAPGETTSSEKMLYFTASPRGIKSLINGKGKKITKKWEAVFGVSEEKEIVEIAIPFALLDFDPSLTKNLRLNVIKKWSEGYGNWASWVDVANLPDARTTPAHLGKIELVSEAPVLSLDSLGQVHYATLDLKGHVFNSEINDFDEKIKLTVRLQPTDLKERVGPEHGLMVGEKSWSGTVLEADREINIKNPKNIISIIQDYQDTDINSVLIKAEDAFGNMLYEQQVPFVCTPPILIKAKTYPKNGRVDIVADVSEYREAKPSELSADIIFLDEEEKILGEISIAKFNSAIEIISYDLAKLPEEAITVRATLRKIDGQKISTSRAIFTKLAPAPWLNTSSGFDDKVIAPFEPMKVEGTSVSLWNRTYVWKDSLLPVEIYTQGVQILAAPIELYTGEKPTGTPNKAKVKIIDKSNTTVHLEAKGKIKGVPVTSKILIEYDGMIYYELYFEPTRPAKLSSLKIEVPLKTKYAWLYHFFGKGGAVVETENRRGPMNSAGPMSVKNSWLGTPDLGLTFFTASVENWNLKNNPTPAFVKVKGPVTNFTATISNNNYKISKQKKISFGLIATPVKPMRNNWRFFRAGRDWSYNWFGVMHNSNNNITKMNPRFPVYLKKKHQTIPLHVVYVRPDWINLSTPESAYYREEWTQSHWRVTGTDGGGVPGENKHLTVCLGSDWQDFLLYYEMKIMDAAKGDGFYHDGAAPFSCKNTNHGHGYVDAEGKLQPVNTLFAYRRYYKRLAIEMDKRKENWQDYLIWLHQSNHFNLPAYSFANMGWNGEQFSISATRTRDYTKLMTPEYFLSEFHGKQFGYPVQWLVEFFNKEAQPPIGKKEIDSVLCFSLITGTQELALASNMATGREYYIKVIDRADEFGLNNNKEMKFVGWWENKNYFDQLPNDNKMKCSLWKTKSKVLFMIGNANSGVDRNTTIKMNLKSLGLTGNLTAMDWWTKQSIPMSGNAFTVEVKGSSWRMIAIENIK